MTSIPLGTAEIQIERQGSRRAYVERLQECINEIVREVVARCIEAALDAEVTELLGREWYKRRESVPHKVTDAQCTRCGTQAAWCFERDGHYPRQLDTNWGHIHFGMPQLECDCGGHVRVEFQTVRPRQRIWDDVEAEMREHYGWGESLRAIKAGLDRRIGSSLGLRTINERIHAVQTVVHQWRQRKQPECPPVVRLDGLWVPQMVRTGETRIDALGRKRPVKRGERRPLLVAQGVWPASGRQAVVAWVLSAGEDSQGWLKLLQQMWERNIRPQAGLRLLVADGTTGLTPVRKLVYWNVPFQRCIFHKLDNVWDAITSPNELSRSEARDYKKKVLQGAKRIWQAADEETAREQQTDWCLQWEREQPDAVATVRRDFDQTVTFYQVQAAAARRGEQWPATDLRTTSHLERLFRGVRRRVRQALVLHSPTGLEALAYQCFTRWAAGQSSQPRDRADWPLKLERVIAGAAPIP